MKPIGLLAFLVLALAIPSPLLAQTISGDFTALRKPVTLSYSMKEVMPPATKSIPTTETPEHPGQSRRDRARVLNLTYQQKQALILAYRAGDHYGIGLLFAAVVMQESTLCADAKRSSTGALGCAQVEEVAVRKVTGVTVPEWQLADPNLQEENMAIGARYLDLCLQRFGYPAGIGCYYEGETRAAKLGRGRLSRLPYTKAVLANMKMLEQLPQDTD